MPSTPEQKFYQRIVRAFPTWDFQRIETTTGSGVPDIHVCAKTRSGVAVTFWLETKIQKSKTTQIRKEQLAWTTKRGRLGDDVFIISLTPDDEVKVWECPIKEFETGRKDHVKILDKPWGFCWKSFKALDASFFQSKQKVL